MQENQVSLTALISAFGRAYHARYESPKIFEDDLAYRLFSEEEFAELGRNIAAALPFLILIMRLSSLDTRLHLPAYCGFKAPPSRSPAPNIPRIHCKPRLQKVSSSM